MQLGRRHHTKVKHPRGFRAHAGYSSVGDGTSDGRRRGVIAPSSPSTLIKGVPCFRRHLNDPSGGRTHRRIRAMAVPCTRGRICALAEAQPSHTGAGVAPTALAASRSPCAPRSGTAPTRPPSSKVVGRMFEAMPAATGLAWFDQVGMISTADFTVALHKSLTLAGKFAETPAEAAAAWCAIDSAGDAAMRCVAHDLGAARQEHRGRR